MRQEKDNNIFLQLKAEREKAGLSQRDIATNTGIQQAQLSKIENGLVEPRFASVEMIAHALELEIVLVPRRSLPAVLSILGNSSTDVSRPAYSLDGDDGE